MKTTVVVTTYNRPDALALTLRGFFLQDDLNFDVIVADDGSNDLTRQTVEELKTESPVDLLHVWHEDIGFRAAGIRNKAIRASRSDYLIFTDGDCVPRNSFVRKHKELAEKGWFLSGNRVLLSRRLTDNLLNHSIQPNSWGVFTVLRHYLFRDINRVMPFFSYPTLTLVRKLRPRRWRGVKTCNFSAWKSDLADVNGFEEEYVGWGLEDSDLTVRLIKKGVRHKSARQATPTLHLWHAENDRSHLKKNEERLKVLLDTDKTNANLGLEKRKAQSVRRIIE